MLRDNCFHQEPTEQETKLIPGIPDISPGIDQENPLLCCGIGYLDYMNMEELSNYFIVCGGKTEELEIQEICSDMSSEGSHLKPSSHKTFFLCDTKSVSV